MMGRELKQDLLIRVVETTASLTIWPRYTDFLSLLFNGVAVATVPTQQLPLE